ncbi:MAG: polyprenyl synthetase family protein [Solirubrobacterales bacterium]
MTRSSAVPPPVTAVIDAAGAWLPARMGEVERRLRELVVGHGPELGGDATATLAAGGKRMRPLLVLLCAGPDPPEAAARAATAVELVHMATLVHDDVLDAAPVRRGRPTVVASSGRERAVSVGDLLFSRAFAELTDNGGSSASPPGPPLAQAGRMIEILSGSCVALAQGELAQRRDAFDISVTEERYLERCRLKTAQLFESACRMGRLASGLPGERALAGFGEEIGLAFQMLDDVLDVTGPSERTGKARGTDLLDGTVNLPLILAVRQDPGIASVELRGLDQAGADALCDRIAASGVLDAARERARDGVERAKALLDGELPESERELLGLVADGVVERYS